MKKLEKITEDARMIVVIISAMINQLKREISCLTPNHL